MIYFAQGADGGPIKIGTTENLPQRIRTLEGHYSRSLVVLATLDGGRDEERQIHEKFAHLRMGKTEQFRPEPELVEFIGAPLVAAAGDVVLMPSDGRKPMVVQIRGSEEFKAWIEELADLERDTVAKFVERVVRKHAESIGFREMPDR
jgi:hypothetical protein